MFGLGTVFGSPKKDLSTNGPSTLVIKSKDIDITKFSESHVVTMREKFPGLDDQVLARYLIARNNDLEKACEQLTRALNWQALHCPVMKSSCQKEIASGKLYVRGVDKEGRPLLVYRSCKSFPAERDLEECGRMLVWFAEHVKKRLPPHLTKYTLLIDRVGHKQENTDQELMKHMSGAFGDMYPETVQRIIVYPADVVLYTVWAVVKWFMDPVTREKVQPMMMLSGVEQYIDRQYIPKSMGGDDDYEYSPEHFDEPYTAEDLAAYAANAAARGVGGVPVAYAQGVEVPTAQAVTELEKEKDATAPVAP